MLLNEAEVLIAIEAADQADRQRVTKVGAHERRHTGGRKAIPAHFPRMEIPHDLSEEQKICTKCPVPDGEVSKLEVEKYLGYAMEGRRRVKEQLKKMGGLEYWDTTFSYLDLQSGQETFVPVTEMGSGSIIAEGGLPPGSIYTIGSDAADNRLAMFLLQTQMTRGSGRIVLLGNLSSKMKDAVKTADAYLKANLRNLGIDQDLKAYDFTVRAINLNQAKEGAETAVAFFLSMVSALLGKPVLDRTVVLGDMSVQGMLLKVSALPERMQLAVEAGAKRILIPSENKRDLPDVPDAILTAIQWQFYDSPTRAAILAMGMG